MRDISYYSVDKAAVLIKIDELKKYLLSKPDVDIFYILSELSDIEESVAEDLISKFE